MLVKAMACSCIEFSIVQSVFSGISLINHDNNVVSWFFFEFSIEMDFIDFDEIVP